MKVKSDNMASKLGGRKLTAIVEGSNSEGRRVTSQVALYVPYKCEFICIHEEPFILEIGFCYRIQKLCAFKKRQPDPLYIVRNNFQQHAFVITLISIRHLSDELYFKCVN